MPKPSGKIRVLVVDDSAVSRDVLTHVLRLDPEIEVIATAVDAFDARRKLVELRPDVMTLDIGMPRVDGLTFLERLMAHLPTPTVVVSALAGRADAVARALALGAVAALEKPEVRSPQALAQAGAAIRAAVKSAAGARDDRIILAIGASTGGPEALKTVLSALPAAIPPTVIVQHMPAKFTPHFAARLNELVPFAVKEAVDGDELRPGLALLAPGDWHLEVVATAGRWQTRLTQAPLEHGVRPAVDVMMRSIAELPDVRALGVILTGMGKDGAAGLKRLRDRGARTIAQDEASCVVYGMPKAACEVGAVEKVAPLGEIAGEITALLRGRLRC